MSQISCFPNANIFLSISIVFDKEQKNKKEASGNRIPDALYVPDDLGAAILADENLMY